MNVLVYALIPSCGVSWAISDVISENNYFQFPHNDTDTDNLMMFEYREELREEPDVGWVLYIVAALLVVITVLLMVYRLAGILWGSLDTF